MRFNINVKVVLTATLVFAISGLIILSRCSYDIPAAPAYSCDPPRVHTLPTIFIITPTYQRPEQFAELTRLGQAFSLAGGIHWIIIEDSNHTSPRIDSFLNRISRNLAGFTHLFVPTPETEKLGAKEARWRKVRGVHQRNAGLNWLRAHQKSFLYQERHTPVVYFADDDNTYDVRLFEKMRDIEEIGAWPVGLVGKLLYEGPVCDETKSHIVKWRTNFRPDRFCACDMAGFAVNIKLILKSMDVEFSPNPGIGNLEAHFLSRLVFGTVKPPPVSESLRHIKPIICDEILVWHTQTIPSDLTAEKVNKIPAVLSV